MMHSQKKKPLFSSYVIAFNVLFILVNNN